MEPSSKLHPLPTVCSFTPLVHHCSLLCVVLLLKWSVETVLKGLLSFMVGETTLCKRACAEMRKKKEEKKKKKKKKKKRGHWVVRALFTLTTCGQLLLRAIDGSWRTRQQPAALYQPQQRCSTPSLSLSSAIPSSVSCPARPTWSVTATRLSI